MKTFVQDLPQHSKPVIEKVATRLVSMPKPQDTSHQDWRQELARKMVESGNRMETDPEYRRKIQSMTH